MLKRRAFLKVGVVGSLVITGVVTINQFSGNNTHQTSPYQFLNSSDVAFFGAVTPAILGLEAAKLKLDAIQQDVYLKQLDEKLAYLSPALQQELRELLDLISSPLTQWLVTGVRGSWEHTSKETITNFLQRWQTSRISLLRKAHHALTQLCIMTWYSLPNSWSTIGYPGPPFKDTLITQPN